MLPLLRVSAQTSVEAVSLSKRLLNTSESISIGRRCDSTLTAFVAHPSRSFDEPHQSDRISLKVPLQDLSRQWSFLVLIIVTQSLQAYQQTRSLGYSESRTTRQGLLWKKHTKKRDHVAPLLKELHWLPVKFCCQYKITTLAYCHFKGSLPPYLSSSLCTYEPSRSLQSSKEKLLKIPKRNLKSFRKHSFSFMAPSVWNSLPADLRNLPTLSQFKSNLKTFLFAQAFPQI